MSPASTRALIDLRAPADCSSTFIGPRVILTDGSVRSGGAGRRARSAPRMSAARRGLRKTWRWPTLGFSASRPAASSASPTSSASARSLPAKPRARWREVGVVAAPLAHAVEPLEDPAGDAARRVGVVVRARRRRPPRRPRGRRGPRPRARRATPGRPDGRPAARPRARPAADGPGRSAREVGDVLEQRRRERERERPEPVDRRDLLLEGQRDELGVGGAGGDLQRQVAVERPARSSAARPPAGLDQGADQRGDQQPGALVDGVGVGAQLGRDRRDGDHAVGRAAATATTSGCVVARARRPSSRAPCCNSRPSSVRSWPTRSRGAAPPASARTSSMPVRVGRMVVAASLRRCRIAPVLSGVAPTVRPLAHGSRHPLPCISPTVRIVGDRAGRRRARGRGRVRRAPRARARGAGDDRPARPRRDRDRRARARPRADRAPTPSSSRPSSRRPPASSTTEFVDAPARVAERLDQKVDEAFGAETAHVARCSSATSATSQGAVQHQVRTSSARSPGRCARTCAGSSPRRATEPARRLQGVAARDAPSGAGAADRAAERHDEQIEAMRLEVGGAARREGQARGGRGRARQGHREGAHVRGGRAEALDRVALAQGDDCEAVGDFMGARARRATSSSASTAAPARRAGGSSSRSRTSRLSKPKAVEELDRCKAERNADYAILVVPSEDKVPARMLRCGSTTATSSSSRSTPRRARRSALQVAYSLARARVLMAKGGGDGVDTRGGARRGRARARPDGGGAPHPSQLTAPRRDRQGGRDRVARWPTACVASSRRSRG